MEEWKEYKLGDVCSRLRSGKGIKADSVFNAGKYPVIGGNGIRGYANESNFEGQAAVIGRQGAYCGNVRFFEGEAYMTEHAVVAVGNEHADTHFLACLLSLMHLGNLSAQSAQPGISVQTLSKQLVRLPSISYQKRVSAIIKSFDDKIEINRRINDNFRSAFLVVMLILLLTSLRNDNLEQQAQALFKSWFVDFEPFKDGEFVESEQGMIPNGWRVGTLNELGNIVGGSTPSKAKPEYYTNNGIAWLTPKDLSISQRKFTSKGQIDITQEGYDSCSTKLMPKGSVLFSSRAPIGYLTIAKNDICTNQGFKSVIPKLAGTAFLYCFLKESTQEIENKATGSTFKEVSGTLMKSLPAIIPEKAILHDFDNLLTPLFYQQEVVEEENTLLSSLRDSLLPRLMSGELNVSEINM